MGPLIQISADEVNHIIYAYFQDSGFEHTAFALRAEGRLESSSHFNDYVPRGELVELLTKALLYSEVETHWQGDTMLTECRTPFSLLRRHECSSEPPLNGVVVAKEDAKHMKNNGFPDSAQKRKADGLALTDIKVEKRARQSNETEASDDTSSRPTPAPSVKQKESKPSSISNSERPRTPVIPSNVDAVKKHQPSRASTLSADTTNQDPVMLIKGHVAEVFVCAWNPSTPELLATGSKDATVRIWNCPAPPEDLPKLSQPPQISPVVLKHLPRSDQTDITSLDWNADGTLLATGSYDSILRVWTAPGEFYMSHPQHQGPIFSTRFSESGRWLLSASLDGTACVWDVAEKKLYMQFRCHAECCLDVDWLDDSTFASCGADKLIHVMQLGNPNPLKTFKGHTNEINQIKFNPGRTRLASCSDDQTARIWSLNNLFRKTKADSIPGLLTTTARPEQTIILKGHTDSIGSLGWRPVTAAGEHEILATASFDGSSMIWDADTGECLRAIKDHKRSAYTLTFSPEGKFFATGSGDGSLFIYNVATRERVWSWQASPEKPGIYEIAWQQHGKLNRIAMSLESRAVGVIDVTRVPALMA